MQQYKEIEITMRSKLQIIKFNRPQKKNAISTVMYEEITAALNDAARNKHVNIVALTGAGDYYSSGNDISGVISNIEDIDKAMEQATQRFNKFISAFIDFPKILVAVVNGPAIGVAATTLGLCDVVYASNKAAFLTPFTSSGLVPEGCSSYTYPRIMGTSLAGEMLYLNRKLTAEDAKSCGLVSEIFIHEHLDEVWPRLEKHSSLPALSMHYTKRLIRKFDLKALHEANYQECEQLKERSVSEDHLEAAHKFFERRSKL